MTRRLTDPRTVPIGPPHAPAARPVRWPWIVASLLATALGGWWASETFGEREPFVVGILHSRSGPTAPQERSLIDAEVLALEEINRNGGLLGRRVRWVIADGGADGTSFARQAERLIRDDRADVLVGCWSATSRRAVVSVVEANDHLLMHPHRHEGFEESRHVVSMGPLPNQLIAPAVAWCRETMSASRFFLVGTDDPWSRSAGAFLGDQLTGIDASLVGEEYLASGSLDMAGIVAAITTSSPDVVFSLMGGESTAALLRQLREAGVRPADLPVMIFSVNEDELRGMPADDVTGNYVIAGSFPGNDRAAAEAFVRSFRTRYGDDRPASEQAMAAHGAVRLWAEAVKGAGTADVTIVRSMIRHQTLPSPEGVIAVDPENRHAWRSLSVGRIRPDGQIDTLWATRGPTRPTPFPATRSRADWNKFAVSIQREKAPRRSAAPSDPRPGITP